VGTKTQEPALQPSATEGAALDRQLVSVDAALIERAIAWMRAAATPS
jgi:hypothetical protein